MDLKPCRSCGKPVAYDAETCPKCGKPDPTGFHLDMRVQVAAEMKQEREQKELYWDFPRASCGCLVVLLLILTFLLLDLFYG